MIDLADKMYPRAGEKGQSGSRLAQMSTNVLVFAIGCGAAALLYTRLGVWCFVLPPILGILSLVLRLAGRPKTGA